LVAQVREEVGGEGMLDDGQGHVRFSVLDF